jgi:hypothetical protein
MSQTARVFSFDALETLHAALARFGVQGQEALAAAETEIRRCVEGVRERLNHWQREIHRRQEDVNRARSDLAHRRAMNEGRRTGAVDQEIALKKAQDRLREAEEKVQACRRWLVQLPEVVREYEGYSRLLAGMLDANLKQALILLRGKVDVLKAYAGLQVPTADQSRESIPAPAAPADQPPSSPPAETP